jgi:hypothetical protein
LLTSKETRGLSSSLPRYFFSFLSLLHFAGIRHWEKN